MRFNKTHAATVLFIVACFCLGCEPNKKTLPNKSGQENTTTSQQQPAQHQPDATASEILAATAQRYRQAKTYQDQAVLYLSYTLDGERYEEPKRWSTKYSSAGLLAAEVFNAKIKGNGKILGCEIFDISTANFDNQTLAIPYGDSFGRGNPTDQTTQPPLKVLLRDPIARKYITGFSEMPLEPSYEDRGPWLIPPPLSLLTRQVANPWLEAPEKTERYVDDKIGDKNCFSVRSHARGLTVDIWINQADMSIVQMSLPHKLLADGLVARKEVSEVVLFAKFHDATFDQPIAATQFEFAPRPEAVLVRKLVSLPESLPSELIGQTAPKFQLQTPQGQPRQRRFFDGKTTALVWLSGDKSIQTAAKLKRVFTQNGDRDFEFGIVYSDTDTQQPGSGQPTPSAAIAKLSRDLAVPAYYDQQHAVSSQLKIQSVPAVAVLDGDARIQYVATLIGDDWDVRLAAAIKRVAAGDNLASEMQTSYERYLDTYHQQLAAVSADGIAGLPNQNPTKRPLANITPASTKRLKVQPQKRFDFDQLKQPGNVVGIPTPSGASFAIFDGQQTLAMIDDNGQLIGKRKLELREDEPATTVRAISVGGKTWLAVFSVMGQQVHLLDQQLNQQAVVPKKEQANRRILDAQLYSPPGKPPRLLIAWQDGGVESFDMNGGDSGFVSEADFESLAATNRTLAGIKNGRAKTVVGEPHISEDGIQFVRLAASEQQLIGVGQNVHGKWSAIGLDDSLEQVWAIETGAQLHENFVTPIASVKLPSGQPLWAIADSNQMVHLVTGNGQWLGEFEAEGKISGLCLQAIGDKTVMVISTAGGVECWELGL